jgi:hypothetical protein
MPMGPMNFMAIHNIIKDFLHQRGIGFRSLQPCPLGQAYVRFNYLLQRDLLIEGSHLSLVMDQFPFCLITVLGIIVLLL